MNMVKLLKENILDKGHKVLNQKATRNLKYMVERESCLDYLITNRVDRIINFESIYPSFSDHSLLVLRRRTRPMKSTRQYIRT